jgi:hypothetical protein
MPHVREEARVTRAATGTQSVIVMTGNEPTV